MKKVFFLVTVLSVLLSACLPGFLQPQATATSGPAPLLEDLQATATFLAQETLQSLSTVFPSATSSSTPPAMTATNTPTPKIPTETQNPVLLTLTATLGTGTVQPVDGTIVVPSTSASSTPVIGTPGPLHAGTMPPNLPFGKITLINRSKTEVYISLRCVTPSGYITIVEYPVGGMVKANIPAGKYTYVLWVGGRQILGDFALGKAQSLMIKIFKDRVEIR
jgi:hypothetical protein